MKPSITKMVVAVAVLAIAAGCVRKRPRPEGVPEDATRIPEPWGKDLWQYCWMSRRSVLVECRITNVVGVTLSEGVFVPVTGPTPRAQADLKILPTGGNTWIELENHAILVPREDFESHKEFLERLGYLRERH